MSQKASLGILATKIGMTQIFNDEGVRVPVTVLQVGDNKVVQKKSVDKDGYVALQVGYESRPTKGVSKALAGHFKKAGVDPVRHLVEFRCTEEEAEKYELGAEISVEALNEAASLDISGTSKGKGFAGVMKRHNFAGFRATHGTHEFFRHGGSIGMCAKPGRVFKGKKMAGQMGNVRVTTVNLAVEDFIEEDRLILVRGAVPGSKNGVVELRPSERKVRRGKALSAAAQAKSRNPMKISKAGG